MREIQGQRFSVAQIPYNLTATSRHAAPADPDKLPRTRLPLVCMRYTQTDKTANLTVKS